MTTYRAVPCGCRSPVCNHWHVSPVADVQCVSFTEEQARAVATLLNASCAGSSMDYCRGWSDAMVTAARICRGARVEQNVISLLNARE